MTNKIKELQKMCEKYHVDLRVQYYNNHEVCFKGINDNDDEIFTVCVWYPPERKRILLFDLFSDKETWTGGQFSKEEILLLLSIDDLTDEELNIKPQSKVGKAE